MSKTLNQSSEIIEKELIRFLNDIKKRGSISENEFNLIQETVYYKELVEHLKTINNSDGTIYASIWAIIYYVQKELKEGKTNEEVRLISTKYPVSSYYHNMPENGY